MRTVVLFLLLPTCYAILSAFGRLQSVGVKGKLKCNGNPARGIKVKLYEKEIMVDRKLDHGLTDASGSFKLSGSAREVSEIDPQLNIYHKCNYNGPCHKKITIKIPSRYITNGKTVQEYFDVGFLELAMKPREQITDCIN